jgi:glycosyltransferase involved in cell wall biosynthesis
MAVYNGENYIREAVDSILCQTYSNFELIISDNASTDKTQQICEEYKAKDDRVKYYRNEKNLGAVPNLNRVFKLSSGEYFKWADHDDNLAADFLAKCVAVLDKNQTVGVCFPRAKLIDAHGNLIGDYDPLPKTDSQQPHTRFGNLIVYPDGRAIQTMGLIRAKLLQKTHLNGSYPSSDEVLMAHLALLGNFFEVPERLIYYRIHPKQSSKGILASERARVLFVDTSLKNKTVLIKWPYLKDCLYAIHHAPISSYQRVRCYIHLLQWLMVQKNFRSMSKDTLLVIHGMLPIFPQLYREVQETANAAERHQS